MPYYQDIVGDYLRAERTRFISPEYLLDLGHGGPLSKGCWWIDVLAVDFKEKAIFLCEVSYSKTLTALVRRLRQWSDQWDAICPTLFEHTHVPNNWQITPWVFIPRDYRPVFDRKFKAVTSPRFAPRITDLEDTAPWKFTDLATIAAEAKMAELSVADPSSVVEQK